MPLGVEHQGMRRGAHAQHTIPAAALWVPSPVLPRDPIPLCGYSVGCDRRYSCPDRRHRSPCQRKGRSHPMHSMVEAPPLAIVVVTRNRRASLLRSLARLTAPEVPYPLIVVDNGPTDDTVPAVVATFP